MGPLSFVHLTLATDPVRWHSSFPSFELAKSSQIRANLDFQFSFRIEPNNRRDFHPDTAAAAGQVLGVTRHRDASMHLR